MCVSVFQGSLLVIIVMIGGSETRRINEGGVSHFRVRVCLKSAVMSSFFIIWIFVGMFVAKC